MKCDQTKPLKMTSSLTNPIRYVIQCLLKKPSPYHLRRDSTDKEQFRIYYYGGSIFEGTLTECRSFARKMGYQINPSLYL